MRRLRVLSAYVALGALSPAVAEAGCIHTNQIFSCIDAQGNSSQLSCIGAGVVQTCMDFTNGDWLLVSPHEVLSQVTGSGSTSDIDSQLSSALDARSGQGNHVSQPTSPEPRVSPGLGPTLGLSPGPIPSH